MPLHYYGKVKKLLESLGIEDYDRVRIEKDGRYYEGILMPRPEILDDEHIIVKLDNGYNIGIHIDGAKVRLVRKGEPIKHRELPELRFRSDLPYVPLIVTGGTITSRVDYSTGAVVSHEKPEELLDIVPELADIANIDYVPLLAEFSENLTPDHWAIMARTIQRELEKGAEGVLIAHGTDTMHFTAAALAFMLRDLDKPVVLVGSQRSIDRPSTDAVLNLIAAAKIAAAGPIAESVIVMHGSPHDDYAYAIRGVRARKLHTSRRDAFQPVNEPPLAKITRDKIEILNSRFRRRREGRSEAKLDDAFDPKVSLLYTWPGITEEILESIAEKSNGIVIAGTGLGHTPRWLIPVIKRIIEEGKPVVITSQCLFGRVDLKVYETGRRLLMAGVIPGEDMLPEVALVKLMYALGHAKDLNDVRRIMRTNIAGELGSHLGLDVFPPCWGVRHGV